MPLLNYTTSIEVDKSISEISKSLAKVGANRIMYEYSDGMINSLSFQIPIGPQMMSFRLPTDWKPVLAVMEKDRKIPRSKVNQEQALRVAWRITKDWVEAQVAYIETQIVTTAQVFLPYAITGDGDTLYNKIKQSPQLLLGDQS